MPAPQFLNGHDQCQADSCKLNARALTGHKFYVVEVDIPRSTHVECISLPGLFTQAQVDAKLKTELDKKASGLLVGFIFGVLLTVIIGIALFRLSQSEQEQTLPSGQRPAGRRF